MNTEVWIFSHSDTQDFLCETKVDSIAKKKWTPLRILFNYLLEVNRRQITVQCKTSSDFFVTVEDNHKLFLVKQFSGKSFFPAAFKKSCFERSKCFGVLVKCVLYVNIKVLSKISPRDSVFCSVKFSSLWVSVIVQSKEVPGTSEELLTS